MKTIVGLYDNMHDAEEAITDLVQAGFDRSDISLMAADRWADDVGAAADCGALVDELMKAISGHLTMPAEKKASMLRMTTSSYDHCMAGDTKRSGEIRDLVMTQLRESLGGR